MKLDEAIQKSLVETALFGFMILVARGLNPKLVDFDKFPRALLVLFGANVLFKTIDESYDKVFLSGMIFYATSTMMSGLLPRNISADL
jgi:hypothetical protein